MSKKPNAKQPPKAAPRVDGWENANTGIGILGRDKRAGGNFFVDTIPQEYAETVWRSSDLAARIVETLPNEMLREGYELEIQADTELEELIEPEFERLAVTEKLRRALYFSRAYGGAGILLGADDGSAELSKPLNENSIRTFDFLTVLTPRELQPVAYYSNPLHPKYGEIQTYRLLPLVTDGGSASTSPIVHESRVMRIEGTTTSALSMWRSVNPGWGDSIFVRVLETMQDFQAAWSGAAILLQDFAPPVLKIKGLAKILASVSGDALAERARGIELSRSIARTLIIDSEEEYARQTVNVAGLPEMLEKMMLRLAAAAGMPVSLLMGQAPAGLNATGDSDIRFFYDQVSALQERMCKPALTRIARLMLLNKSGPAKGKLPEHFEIEFEPFWQLSELEQAQVRLTQAQTDQIYLANQVVTPQEIARSRFSATGYSTTTTIDTDIRDELLADEELQLKELGASVEAPTPEAVKPEDVDA